jgi:hypothetical protein
VLSDNNNNNNYNNNNTNNNNNNNNTNKRKELHSKVILKFNLLPAMIEFYMETKLI